MSVAVTVRQAAVDDAPDAAELVGELLAEIIAATGVPAFHFDLAEATARLADFMHRGKYFVFVARAGAAAVGVVTLYESCALYAEGFFGTMAELYVRDGYRSARLGSQLIASARALGRSRGWTRLEVTTPPLPQFERTLAFYAREGFAVTGGRKLKAYL